MNQLPRLEISHVAALVPDIDETLELLHALLGWGPWHIYTLAPPRLRGRIYRGAQGRFSMIGAETRIGPIEFALNQAITGPSIYDEHVSRRGYGLHHIACMGGNEDVRARFESRGVGVTMTGSIDDSITFFYFDTEPLLGVAVESGNGHAISLPPDRTSNVDGDCRHEVASLTEVAVVVGCIDTAAAAYSRLLGWGPWTFARGEYAYPPSARAGDSLRTSSTNTARTRVGPVEIELCQQGHWPNSTSASLALDDIGLHHITCGVNSADREAMAACLRARNITVAFIGQVNGRESWYVDSNPRLKLVFTDSDDIAAQMTHQTNPEAR